MEEKDVAPSVLNLGSLSWIGSASFDLLFLANIGWPLLLIPGISSSSETAIDFWQVYYLTLPHRWITLFLVVVDPDRREQHSRMVWSMAIVSACVVLGAYVGSGALLCLGVIDYFWNGWHFASQHAGVLRIYSRKSPSGNELLERWGMRCFIFYVIARTSSTLLWNLESIPIANTAVSVFDWMVLSLPIALILTNLVGWRIDRLPKLVYLSSVLTLYSSFLLSSHFRWPRLFLCFATAAALFHAVEYLAIVSHYASRREHIGSGGMMRQIASRWNLILTVFLLSLGTFGVWASSPTHGYSEIWQGVNLWAAFTHYALDGVIWKLRRPETARALGVE